MENQFPCKDDSKCEWSNQSAGNDYSCSPATSMKFKACRMATHMRLSDLFLCSAFPVWVAVASDHLVVNVCSSKSFGIPE